VLDAFAARYDLHVETESAVTESVFFPLPRVLRPVEAAE
jgi:4-hydroxy-3-methylbut-2-en-1-yl diphosphate reductase